MKIAFISDIHSNLEALKAVLVEIDKENISLIVNFGMWWERFVIIVGGVAHGFSPHAWGLYAPSLIEYGIMLGTFCLFFFLFLLFAKQRTY